MRRLIPFMLLIALVAAACGDDGSTSTAASTPAATDSTTAVTESSTAAPAETSTSAAGATSTSAAPATSEAPTETTATSARPVPEGPPAPDFTLPLGVDGEGGSFTLSEEMKPVFMVFWAEW